MTGYFLARHLAYRRGWRVWIEPTGGARYPYRVMRARLPGERQTGLVVVAHTRNLDDAVRWAKLKLDVMRGIE